jgi:hypothetical protein
MVGAAVRAARATCQPARPGRRQRMVGGGGSGSRRLGNAIGEANPEELSYTASSARASPFL